MTLSITGEITIIFSYPRSTKLSWQGSEAVYNIQGFLFIVVVVFVLSKIS